jgi:hypothetical protein
LKRVFLVKQLIHLQRQLGTRITAIATKVVPPGPAAASITVNS